MDKRRNILAGVRDEIKKVTFPSKKTTIRLTAAVFVISLIVAMYLGIIDFLLTKILNILISRK